MTAKRKKSSTADNTAPWWKAEDRAAAISAVVSRARQADKPREEAMARALGQYLLRKVDSLSAQTYDMVRKPTKDDPRMPIVGSIVDTVHAKLLRNAPKTAIMTIGGSWSEQRSAERLEKFIDGTKKQAGWAKVQREAVLDAAMWGPGIAWPRDETWTIKNKKGEPEERGRIRIDRLYPWQVRVDPREAGYGKPMSMFIEHFVDRHVALARWPKHAAAINAADRADSTTTAAVSADAKSDLICIVFAYRLPSHPGAGDGHEVAAIYRTNAEDGGIILEREYKRETFPVVMMPWRAARIGYWPHSLVDNITGLHDTSNEVDETIRKRVSQAFGLIFNYGTEAIEPAINTDHDIDVVTMPPGSNQDLIKYEAPNLVSQELFNERDKLPDMARRFSGASELSISGTKPSGLDSRVALREYQDIETERFTIQGEEMEAFDLGVSRAILELAREMHDRGIDLVTRADGKRRRESTIEKIKWSTVALPDESFEITTSPKSARTQEEAFQTAIIEQVIAGGFISNPGEALLALNNPDADAMIKMRLAPLYLAMDMISDMLENGQKRSPIPEMNLNITIHAARLSVVRATSKGAPEENIGLVRAFIGEALKLQKDAAMQAAEAQAAAQGGAFTPNAGQMQAGLPTNEAPQGAPVVA